MLINTEEKIIRFNISMDNLSFVQKLNPFQHLVANHEGTLQRHYFTIVNENILDTAAQQIHQHHIVLAFSGDCMNFGYSNNIH